MYISTSKGASEKTEALCSILAKLLPFGVFEPRGRKRIEDIFEKAKALGKTRACLLYEKEKRPHKLVFLSIGRTWEWLEPEIIVKKISAKNVKEHYENIEIRGPRKKELEHLIHPKGYESEPLNLFAGEKELVFSIGKRKLLSLEVSYGSESKN